MQQADRAMWPGTQLQVTRGGLQLPAHCPYRLYDRVVHAYAMPSMRFVEAHWARSDSARVTPCAPPSCKEMRLGSHMLSEPHRAAHNSALETHS